MVVMNAVTPNIEFSFAREAAFARLGPAEKAFVEGFVSDVETFSVRSGQTLQDAAKARVMMISDQRSLDLLNIALVQAAIEDRLRKIADDFEMSEYKTVRSLTNIAHSTMEKFIRIDEWGDAHIDFSNVTSDDLEAMQSFKITETDKSIIREVKLHPKMDAIKTKLQLHGMLDGEKWKEAKNRAAVASRLDASLTNDQVQDKYQNFIADDD